MPDIFNLPTEETSIRMANALEIIANTRTIADFSEAPGSKYLLAGDRDAGYFGFVPSVDLLSGTDLALTLGITGGTAINSDSPWIKYVWNGRVCFTPLKPLRHSITWNQIYEAGAVYGKSNEGTLPPNGRLGIQLSIDGSDNSINSSIGKFLGDSTVGDDYADTVAAVANTVTLKGWANGANNGIFTVGSITNSKIVLSGGTLVTEAGDKDSTIYNNAKKVTQSAMVVVGGVTYRVRLFKGAANDPLDSYGNSDRDMVGPESEWNGIILPLHERAKTGNWNHVAYAGAVEDWGIYLTDADLITHHLMGSGSYSWCQETRDDTSWRRVVRGYLGASFGTADPSFSVSSPDGWRPVLELL